MKMRNPVQVQDDQQVEDKKKEEDEEEECQGLAGAGLRDN
jgi:hypothetical protein